MSTITESILNSTKKALGLEPDYTAFDPEITMHINSIFSVLNQLGIGPAQGFMIEDDVPVWSDFLGSVMPFNSVKTYMYLRVRLLFDPPNTSYLIEAMETQKSELEWRISVERENQLLSLAEVIP